jgi:hypothetical protein
MLILLLVATQSILSVDVIGILAILTTLVLSYASLSASILILASIYIVRTGSGITSLLGILILIYSFDTAASSAILSLWLCISSILLSLQIMSSVHLGAIYITMSTLTTCLYWVSILSGISFQDTLPSYAAASLILILLVWSVSSVPRLGHMTLLMLQVLSKGYIYIATLLLIPSNSTTDMTSLLPATLISLTVLLSSMEVRSSILVLSSVWIIQLTTVSSTLGLSSLISVYLVMYIALSIVLILQISSARTWSDLCMLVITTLVWSGMPLTLVAVSKLILILALLSWSTILAACLAIVLWSLCATRVLLVLLTDPNSYPIWFLTLFIVIFSYTSLHIDRIPCNGQLWYSDFSSLSHSHSRNSYTLQPKLMPISTWPPEWRESTADGCNWASLWQIFRFRVSWTNSDVKIDQLQTKMIHNFYTNSSTIFSSSSVTSARIVTSPHRNLIDLFL